MIKGALDDAGLALSDVDGVCSANMGMMASMELAEYLRIQPRWTDNTMTGGSAFEVHVDHAATAIAANCSEVVPYSAM